MALVDAVSQLNLIRTRIASMTEEHQRDLASVQKEKEAALRILKSKHKEEIKRLVLDTDAEQEGLVSQHRRELAEVLARIEGAKPANTRALETELVSLKEEVKTLRQSEEQLSQKIETLTTQLQQSALRGPRTSAGGFEMLTDCSGSTALAAGLKSRNMTGVAVVAQSGDDDGDDDLLENGPGEQRDFLWSQFVFPIAKRNQSGLSQPSTMLLSGGFMLVGLGVYALWHKAGMPVS
ncbi:hypothetical protein EDD21DRAFT_85992 [Dissophora ornata]|nr:hypothetical protein EDD21DRAFT_85992 [Dissophora ornata]